MQDLVPYEYRTSTTYSIRDNFTSTVRYCTVQADLMMPLLARIRDFLCEFLSQSIGEKPR